MQILQDNCNHSHAICVATFEVAKKVDADMVCLVDPYIGGVVQAHTAYEIRWGMEDSERNSEWQ